MKAKTISIGGKCSDCFWATVKDEKGNKIGNDYSGYVPKFMPGKHYGDNIILDIDLETGKILNWTPPTEEEINSLTGGM
jgi:hypothetical protein